MNDYKVYIEKAKKAMVNSYSPYSKFSVGACVIGDSGKYYTGTNIENVSYGATVCAERVAVFQAISSGERVIKDIYIISDSSKFIYPCGICRQVIDEFASLKTKIICANSEMKYEVYQINDLLPCAFNL